MFKQFDTRAARQRRHRRIRRRVVGTTERPRLSVFRSLQHIYGQVIDDSTGRTLATASTLDPGIREELADATKTEAARKVGAELARRSKQAGVTAVVFDRGGYLFHGRVKALADAARENGLSF